jgi:hypothetical protein
LAGALAVIRTQSGVPLVDLSEDSPFAGAAFEDGVHLFPDVIDEYSALLARRLGLGADEPPTSSR